jgi:saccharopine dehydrogenase-like NADP-dependent oxidoreductase
MFEIGKDYDLPVVGTRRAYLCGHDEVHSLAKNMDGADVRFWMGFGDHYINVFTVLKIIGLLSEQPVKLADGSEVVPLKVVKACLPDPASLAPEYEGKTCIGDYVKGLKDGKEKTVFIYNVADHKDAYNEVGSQGISYTAGVPPVAAAMLVATGEWDVKKMANVEELDPKPFITLLERHGPADPHPGRGWRPRCRRSEIHASSKMPCANLAVCARHTWSGKTSIGPSPIQGRSAP